MQKRVVITAAALVLALLIGFAGGYGFFSVTYESVPIHYPQEAEGLTPRELAFLVADCLKNEDYAALSEFVHPYYGLVFSPKMTVSLKACRCLAPREVATLGQDNSLHVWGTAEGSAVPLELNSADYLAQYVYDRDYSSAQLVGIDYPARVGNALDNTAEVFPNSHYVELCCPGTDAAAWSTLRLVFEEYEGAWRLTALIHAAYIV